MEAINFAEDHGYRLYYVGDDAIGTATYPYPKDPIQRQLRLTYLDKNGTKEVLWANTRLEEMYSIQNKSIPYLSFGGGYGPSLNDSIPKMVFRLTNTRRMTMKIVFRLLFWMMIHAERE